MAPSVDGRSFVPLLLGQDVPWRALGLIEHHGPDTDPGDPDMQDPRAGNPPSYEAIRTQRYTYVQYSDGEHEYYDHIRDPFQNDNRYDRCPGRGGRRSPSGSARSSTATTARSAGRPALPTNAS